MLVVFELTFRLGRSWGAKRDAFAQGQLAAIEASMLGLLALLLGFTFSLSASRFEMRKQIVLDESSALRTAYLRTSLLVAPEERTRLRDLLRRYVDARVEFY